MVGWFQRNVPDERAMCDRRKQESCFREFILFGETVMPSKKPNDKGKVCNCASIVLDLVDRSTSCERTVGREETSRTSVVQCESVMKRVPARQRCDARYARSVKRVS